LVVTRLRCAFLTMDDTDGWSIDSGLSFAPLETLGWEPEWRPWRCPDDAWSRYDAVYVAAPWDYPEDPQHFMQVLEKIDRSGAILVNDLSLIRWNLSKTYLRDIDAHGGDIVPSQWYDAFLAEMPESLFSDLQADQIIVKPVVSTNATDTFLLSRNVEASTREKLGDAFRDRPFVVQPFIENIQNEGEFSLFYFGNRFSHAILKTPGARDFRVQEEHGASIVAASPEPSLLRAAERVLAAVSPPPVYVRCDFVRGPDGRFLLMELEMIEPSMYLRMHADAPRRFAEAFDRHVRRRLRATAIEA